MPDLDAFEAEVKAKIKQLAAKDPSKRRQAAAWLGEAGDPSAITALAQAYKNDKDARVRDAAAYSLGMFRRLEQELRTDEARAVALLEAVADGKMGRRQRLPTRGMVKLEIGLLISALLVAALSFVLPPTLRGLSGSRSPDPAPTQVSSTGGVSRATILSQLSAAYSTVSADATRLKTQYDTVLAGGQLNCADGFAPVAPVTLSEADASSQPDLGALATQVNDAGRELEANRSAFDRACVNGEAVPTADYNVAASRLNVLTQQTLPAIQQALTTAGGQASQPQGGEPTAPAEAPTDVPVPTVPTDISAYLRDLQTILDNMTDLRGAHTVLNGYWTEAQASGATAGCSEPQPTIPEDYTLPPEVASAVPDLALAVNLTDTGLQFLRQGWQLFAQACNSGQPGLSAQSGLAQTEAAATAFTNAQNLINTLRGA